MGVADGTILGTTKIVDNGPDTVRFNLVIMGDGYQQNQITQFTQDAQNFVNALFAAAPFDSLRRSINVHRVDVTSTDSGADDPASCGGTGAVASTYFDAAFCNSGTRRALVVNSGTAITVANAQVPQHHAVMVIVNSTIYGGTGGQVACFSLASGANEIGIHELGHTAFGLADEYEYYLGCSVDTNRNNHSATEPAEPNVTVNSGRDTIKWRDLIASTTPMPTTQNANCSACDPQANPVAANTVGAFEGAHYYHCGAFRPQFTCRMRALGNPFCAVCQRVIRETLRPFLGVSAEWLTALYVDLLGRMPDRSGFFFWLASASGGTSQEGIADGFLNSAEYAGVVISGFYRKFLDRSPDAGGLQGWSAQLEGGVAQQEIIRGFCDSDEYKTNNPPPAPFVESLYQRLLGRPSDPGGKQGWINALQSGSSTAVVIDGFLRSSEYCTQRVTELYQTLLGRSPDAAGLAGWVQAMTAGAPFQQIQKGFLLSDEYGSRASLRLGAGGAVAKWIHALYADVLGRAPDAAGLSSWVSTASGGTSQEGIADGFLNSAEYAGVVISGFYRKFLDRSPDAGGLQGWSAQLEGGVAQQEIIRGFCDSDEYKTNNPPPAPFVESLYQRLLGRPSDPGGKQGWINALQSGSSTAVVIDGFLRSSEYCTQRVTELYQTLLGRSPDAAGLAGWVQAMTAGAPFQQIQKGFLSSDEYWARALSRF